MALHREIRSVMQAALEKRAARMAKLRARGWSYQRIADRYGLSRQGVHQTLQRHGGRATRKAA